MATICLVMIVKNEAAIIRRCLNSAKPVIDHWLICDTGSTDHTKQEVLDMLSDVPGSLHEVPWVDFGHNRSIAVSLAKGTADYLLLLDADMVLNVKGQFKDELKEDAYWIQFEGPCDYYLPLLVSNRHHWRYVGVTHECILSDTGVARTKMAQLTVCHLEDGANRANKCLRDVELLEQGLRVEPDKARYVFYLAQSYRELGNYPAAEAFYSRRASMGGWDEEVWHARYQMARMRHLMGKEWPVVLSSYLEAYESRPWRLEPIVHIARQYRERHQYHSAYVFARIAVEVPYPQDDVLFIEKPVYEYELPTEYAICCYWLGKHEEAIRGNDLILQCPNLPENYRLSAIRNRDLSLQALKTTTS
jgi:glycosyltransferase involved in cell wall biosynthesis